MPWICAPREDWSSPEVSHQILGAVREPIPIDWAKICAWRVRQMRDELRNALVGLWLDEQGYLVDWLLAGLIARENVLLLGPPGVGKTEIATRTFELLGLSSPRVDEYLLQPLASTASPQSWWLEREKKERQLQKYFHYLLSRFTQPEELFGPIEISLLRQGILARVNFGLLTGPGVRAAFLDEIFKASSSILNTLLTLAQERTYFNWGGMVDSDLAMLIGASNEMPGGFATGAVGIGSGGEDFQTLYAFLDRFPIRLLMPLASGTSDKDPEKSDLAKAFDVAMQREGARFTRGKGFDDRQNLRDMPSINDILLLGRCCIQHEAGDGARPVFDPNQVGRFKQAFKRIAVDLQQQNTVPESGKITWTISPRKLKAIYKIALAHALVRDDGFTGTAQVVSLDEQDLHVFDFIWDSPIARNDLETRVRANIMEFWKERRA